jgi:hypothetical protein
MAERHGRTLARLAELSLALAEDVQAAALSASEPEEKARLSVAFSGVARACRQSMALEARFLRDRERAEREATAGKIETRKRQVRPNLERQIVCEIDTREVEAWLGDLDEQLESEALYDAFLDEPLEAHIARLSQGLGLTGEVKRNYTPRTLRRRHAFARDYRLLDLANDDDEADDEPLTSPSGGKRREAPQERVADGGSVIGPPDLNAEDAETSQSSQSDPGDPVLPRKSAQSAVQFQADETPPIGHSASPSGRFPPEGETRPPDPPPLPEEPYVPPWEKLKPGQVWPGSSGW